MEMTIHRMSLKIQRVKVIGRLKEYSGDMFTWFENN